MLQNGKRGKETIYAKQKITKRYGSGGIRTHAPEETGALNQRLRPLGHATLLWQWALNEKQNKLNLNVGLLKSSRTFHLQRACFLSIFSQLSIIAYLFQASRFPPVTVEL